MRFRPILFVFFILLLVVSGCFAQKARVLDTSESVRINKSKPTVYNEFVKIGECSYTETLRVINDKPCDSTRTDIIEKFDAVWIRLINNSKWAIQVDVKNLFIEPAVGPVTLADKRTKTGTSDGAEVDVIYDVEAETGCDFTEEAPPGQPCKFRDAVAPKISRPGALSSVFVLPGRSLVFAVKREHLNKHLSVFVQYSYEWETSEKRTNFEEPGHRV